MNDGRKRIFVDAECLENLENLTLENNYSAKKFSDIFKNEYLEYYAQ